MSGLWQDNLVIPQGTTWAVRFPIETKAGYVVDTTGWTVQAQVRRSVTDRTILHEWSSALGNASVFDTFIELRVSPQDSADWNWGTPRGVYDIEITLPTGEVLRVAQGTITVSKEVTR